MCIHRCWRFNYKFPWFLFSKNHQWILSCNKSKLVLPFCYISGEGEQQSVIFCSSKNDVTCICESITSSLYVPTLDQIRQHFTESFYALRFQKRKKDTEGWLFFALLGSACVKAVQKDVGEIDPFRSQFHQHFTCMFFIRKCFFCQNVTREKHFGTKNAGVKRWWNWHQQIHLRRKKSQKRHDLFSTRDRGPCCRKHGGHSKCFRFILSDNKKRSTPFFATERVSFKSVLSTFKTSTVFIGSWSNIENCLQSNTKPP